MQESLRWHDRAKCKDTDPELFFPLDVTGRKPPSVLEQEKEARAYCVGCEVIDICLETAVGNDEQYGVWGGQTAEERRKARERDTRRRSR